MLGGKIGAGIVSLWGVHLIEWTGVLRTCTWDYHNPLSVLRLIINNGMSMTKKKRDIINTDSFIILF